LIVEVGVGVGAVAAGVVGVHLVKIVQEKALAALVVALVTRVT